MKRKKLDLDLCVPLKMPTGYGRLDRGHMRLDGWDVLPLLSGVGTQGCASVLMGEIYNECDSLFVSKNSKVNMFYINKNKVRNG